MKYIERVAPLKIGTKLKMRDNIYWTKTWTIVSKKGNRYTLTYDGPQKAITARTKEDIRDEFEYMYPWESLVKSISTAKRGCYCTACVRKRN